VKLQITIPNSLHLGPVATPQEEHHPRITLEPNFYYPQEDFLWSFCKHQGISWNIVMPSYILGAVPDAAMNLVYPLGIYAAVTAHLGATLDFPADLQAWEATSVGSSSMLNAYLEEWAVLNEGVKDEKFNAVDGGPFTWGAFWPKLAGWYGVEVGRPSLDHDAYTEVTTRFDPPPRGYVLPLLAMFLSFSQPDVQRQKLTKHSFGPPATYRIRFTLASWAKRPEVQKAWEEVLTKHNLKGATKLQDMDIDRIFSFADGSLAGGIIDLSMNKARKQGWHGFVDTSESFREVLGEFVDLGMLPPVGGN
jgi:hypothetical protein